MDSRRPNTVLPTAGVDDCQSDLHVSVGVFGQAVNKKEHSAVLHFLRVKKLWESWIPALRPIALGGALGRCLGFLDCRDYVRDGAWHQTGIGHCENCFHEEFSRGSFTTQRARSESWSESRSISREPPPHRHGCEYGAVESKAECNPLECGDLPKAVHEPTEVVHGHPSTIESQIGSLCLTHEESALSHLITNRGSHEA